MEYRKENQWPTWLSIIALIGVIALAIFVFNFVKTTTDNHATLEQKINSSYNRTIDTLTP